MIPCVYNTCAHMLALRRDLIAVGSFADVDGKLLIGPTADGRSVAGCRRLRSFLGRRKGGQCN
jgi:hypothetical protein